MKLVKQRKLYFTEGNSDKVYEVDLCESGSDLYIVNFRYGRRGATLRDGTKTVFPIAYDEAIKVFNKLVESKEKKGYKENSLLRDKSSTVQKEAAPDNKLRNETIIKYLKQAAQGNYTRDWKVSRIIWKAGELGIAEAATNVAHFLTSKDEFEQYAAIHTLSLFKDENYQDAILKVFETNGFDNKVGRIAATYIFKLGSASQQSTIRTKALQKLPNELQESNWDTLLNSLSVYYLKEEGIDASALYYLYICTYKNDNIRAQLYQFLQHAVLKVNSFKSIRYIYRAAQELGDMHFFALLSKRIALSKPGFRSDYVYSNDQWISVETEKKKANPSVAFSAKTKRYFNKAAYQNIQYLSLHDEEAYVAYAVNVLSSLDDSIDKQVREIQYFYDYDTTTNRYENVKRFYPKYSEFLALMFILHGNTDRLKHQKSKWYYEEELAIDAQTREEALPNLWNNRPQEVLTILGEAKSEEAVYFALRIIKENKHFLEEIRPSQMNKLVAHYHPAVLDIIMEALESRYQHTKPEEAVLIALLQSKNEKAYRLGLKWLDQYQTDYFKASKFMASLLLTGQIAVIDYLKSVYAERHTYNFPLSYESLAPLFAEPSSYTSEYLIAVNGLIGETRFGELFKTISEEKITALAESTSVTNKLFAANFSKYNPKPVEELFNDSIDNYINSEEAILRRVGIELLSHFPDEYLLKNQNRIGAYCFSEYKEIREAIQPSIRRLVHLDSNFKEQLLSQLLQVIIEPENYEGVHQNSYEVLIANYDKNLSSVTKEGIFGLILSEYEFAQKLGTPLFLERMEGKDLSIEELVQLASSPVFEIRDFVRQFYIKNDVQINYELEPALHIFNSNWDDIIDWSISYFEEHINTENWTTDLLLYVCDHTKQKVQAFGRRMVTAHFSEEKGLPLLLKLQEHPTGAMQFFVTNYLDNYAKDNEEVILKLKDFFKTTLFNINTNRPAKARIYDFLEQESLKSEKVASMTIDLINSVLGTKTILDQSNNIDVLLSIKEAHPSLQVPLLINSN